MKKSQLRVFAKLEELRQEVQSPRVDPYNKGFRIIRKHVQAAINEVCLRFLTKKQGSKGYRPPEDYALADVEEWHFHLTARDFWITDENNHLWYTEDR